MRCYRRVEAALNACFTVRSKASAAYELSIIELILVVHDEQLAAVPWHCYLNARRRLQHHILDGKRSPIAAASGT
ncbi:hypothetical protein [Burkholderia lata]|uniref:hypothetical protein n=1 Tax=Burkholderia lata (strain ATCC 17760 / DSM 23089 / LMG 22485 / NCIMB 9086 / R18194 / 383) TaxID=482957 RepID=UPI001581E46E|nr:hypothetical protein [Burkholderia lata]